MQRRNLVVFGVLMMLITWITTPPPVRAATFEVNTADQLRQAISDANGNNEADTIALGDDITLTSALPEVESTITIVGNGYAIERSSADGTPKFRVLHVLSDGDLTLLNVTIRNGDLEGESVSRYGGGVYNEGGMVVVIKSTITGSASVEGGGLANSGTMKVVDSTLQDNKARAGGGLFNRSSGTMTVTNSTLRDNGANGGGALANKGTVTVTNTNVEENNFNGLFNISGTMTVRNSTLDSNNGRNGGGLANQGGTVTLENSMVTDNSAINVGGGLSNSDTMTVSGSTVVSNEAPYGGGVSNAGNLTLTNSTVTLNTAQFSGEYGIGGVPVDGLGGGLHNGGTLEVINSTVVGNDSAEGGGVFDAGSGIFDDTKPSITLKNTIISANGASYENNECDLDYDGMFTADSDNMLGVAGDAGGCSVGTGDIKPSSDIDALLDTTLRDNGGLTTTHALVSGSPAVDAGGNSACPADDQRGAPRDANCDIGAYELNATTPTYPTVEFVDSSATSEEADTSVTAELRVSGAVDFTDEVTVYVADAGAGSATPDADYDVFPLTSLTLDCGTVDCAGGVTRDVSLTLSEDVIAEGDETVELEIIATDGLAKPGSQDTYTLTITDDETADINLTPSNAQTLSEAAEEEVTFTVSLASKPADNVTVPVSVDGNACTLNGKTAVVLTDSNWDTGADVTVTAVNDAVVAGDLSCDLITGDPVSGSGSYDALVAADVADVPITVTEDDTGSIQVDPTGQQTIREAGAETATFTFTLTAEPAGDVTIPLSVSSNDCTLNGTVEVVLDSSNWDTGVELTVTAVDDAVDDGDSACNLETGDPSSASDNPYDMLTADDVTDVAITVQDNDRSPQSGAGAEANLSLTLVKGDGSGGAMDGALQVLGAGQPATLNVTVTPQTDLQDATLTLNLPGGFILEEGGAFLVSRVPVNGRVVTGLAAPALQQTLRWDIGSVTTGETVSTQVAGRVSEDIVGDELRLDATLTSVGETVATDTLRIAIVQSLPSTGETPWWRNWLLMLGVAGIVLLSFGAYRLRRE